MNAFARKITRGVYVVLGCVLGYALLCLVAVLAFISIPLTLVAIFVVFLIDAGFTWLDCENCDPFDDEGPA